MAQISTGILLSFLFKGTVVWYKNMYLLRLERVRACKSRVSNSMVRMSCLVPDFH